jgi:hypothetical protein
LELKNSVSNLKSRSGTFFVLNAPLFLVPPFCFSPTPSCLSAFFSLLPQHKITNGIGLSAEEHVSWYLKDDRNNRDGEVNGINAALGPKARDMLVSSYYNN